MKHDKWLSELTKLQRLDLLSFLVFIRLLYLSWPFLPCLSIKSSMCEAQEEAKMCFLCQFKCEVFMFIYSLDLKKKRLLPLVWKHKHLWPRRWLNSGCNLSCQQFKIFPGKQHNSTSNYKGIILERNQVNEGWTSEQRQPLLLCKFSHHLRVRDAETSRKMLSTPQLLPLVSAVCQADTTLIMAPGIRCPFLTLH